MTSITIPPGVTITELMRMPAAEILVTYGPEVLAMVANLQGSGLVARDGRTNADLALQAEMRRKIAEEGDCGVADEYAAELAEQEAKSATP